MASPDLKGMKASFLMSVEVPACLSCGEEMNWQQGVFKKTDGVLYELLRCSACGQVYAPQTSVTLTMAEAPVESSA